MGDAAAPIVTPCGICVCLVFRLLGGCGHDASVERIVIVVISIVSYVLWQWDAADHAIANVYSLLGVVSTATDHCCCCCSGKVAQLILLGIKSCPCASIGLTVPHTSAAAYESPHQFRMN